MHKHTPLVRTRLDWPFALLAPLLSIITISPHLLGTGSDPPNDDDDESDLDNACAGSSSLTAAVASDAVVVSTVVAQKLCAALALQCCPPGCLRHSVVLSQSLPLDYFYGPTA